MKIHNINVIRHYPENPCYPFGVNSVKELCHDSVEHLIMMYTSTDTSSADNSNRHYDFIHSAHPL